MRTFLRSIRNSEFLTFSEVLKLKVIIINVFLLAFTLLTIPIDTVDEFGWNINIIIPIVFFGSVIITFLLAFLNINRVAMHLSILTIIGLTYYYVAGTEYLFSYILFFVALTVIIFYQDIITYLLYGGIVTGYGMYYIYSQGEQLLGFYSTNGVEVSSLTYQIIFGGFYVVFLIQFLLSDNIYEKLNNEWVYMNKSLEQYQNFSHSYLVELIEENDINPIFKNTNFQKAILELSTFINEFLEDKGSEIGEVVEYYFFLHEQNVDEVVEDKSLPLLTRKYAQELQKYLLNERSELVSILFDFATLFKGDDNFSEHRYDYNLERLFDNRLDQILALIFLYKYLRTEVTQLDRFDHITRVLTHEEITELFNSVEFRQFLSFEQVNFFIDNEELFRNFL